MVPIKKKKKAKKVVKHEEPDPSKLGLGKGPPPEASPAPGYDGVESPINEEVGEWGSSAQSQPQQEEEDYMSRYQVTDSDGFGDVWGRDEGSR